MRLPDARSTEPLEAAPRPRDGSERRAMIVYGAAFAIAAALFSLFPGIDLWASGLFYHPGPGFFLGDWWPIRAIYTAVPHVTEAMVVGVPALFFLGLLRRRPIWRIDGRAAVFLLLALALGPGLLVNTVLKDHWGRARPSQVTTFAGTQHFTPALLPSDQCARNCSFPAGHPAIGFSLVSFAFLVRVPQRRRLAVSAAVMAGAVIGAARMAQGGHFLSDGSRASSAPRGRRAGSPSPRWRSARPLSCRWRSSTGRWRGCSMAPTRPSSRSFSSSRSSASARAI
jgi:lipid A 4'-phosphatase